MSYNATVYNVMIASPSDINHEREIIRDVLYEWNGINSSLRKTVLLPIGWESHSSPEMGDTPQNIINKQVLDKSDILVGVFWTRIGTPTAEHLSGTVEEIEKHVASGKIAMLFFSNQPIAPGSVDQSQYNMLMQFKESCKERSLFETYDDLSDFREKFFRHLQLKMNDHELFKQKRIIMSNGFNEQTQGFPVLSDAAITLLKEISTDPRGQIFYLRYMGGTSISSNGKQFCATKEPREIAKWRGAIESLLNENLIKRTGSKDEIYTMTDMGYNLADSV